MKKDPGESLRDWRDRRRDQRDRLRDGLRDQLRDHLVQKVAGAWLTGAIGVAWLLGGLYALWLTLGTQSGPAWAIGCVLVPGVAFLLFAWLWAKRDWRAREKDLRAERMQEQRGHEEGIQRLETGISSEREVGSKIEYALIRDCCAVAHDVNEIAAEGDIDHLVATPRGVWVIETKTSRVRRHQFGDVLRRIARNTKSVRDWAHRWESGVQVTGCLVFANHEELAKRSYDYEQEKIRVFASPTELMCALRNEAQGDGGSPAMAQKVWELGEIHGAGDQDGSS